MPQGDVTALAATLDRLMGNSHAREKLGARAPEVLKRFSTDKVLLMWERLFDGLVLPDRRHVTTVVKETAGSD